MSAALLSPPPVPAPRIEAAAFVLALRGRGISDIGILRAMETVPREMFAPRRYLDLARQDVALPLACGETMTAPAIVALMLSALGVRPGHRLLEIGTGSGYVTALLAQLGATVASAERHPVLAESAGHRLRAAGLAGRCEVRSRDGFADDGQDGRYDRIILNGAVAAIPAGLTSRLAAGGRLVCGQAGEGGQVVLSTLSREDDGRLSAKAGSTLRLTRLVVGHLAPGNGSLTQTAL